MRRIFFLGSIIIVALSLSAFKGVDKKKKNNEKPNIVFLLTDDQRYNALGCMGNNEIKTPNIDALASKGVIFTNAYNTTAICMGARASIMTGMYEHKSGCNFTHGPLTSDKFQKSYPVLLRDAGYYTGFTGKFGFAVKDDADGKSGYASNDDMPMDEFDWWKGWPSQGYYQTIKNEFMKEYAEEYPHVSKALGAASVDFIREAKDKNQPFCLSVSFKAPHNPVSPDPAYDDVYAGKDFTEPENYWMKGAEHIPQQAKLGRQYRKLGKKWSPEVFDAALAKYYQLVYGIDVAVGMIVKELEEQGLMENTVIIYTTDNGYFCGSHGFGGKVLPYEEGSRAPLIVYDPYSKLKGTKNDALSATIDVAPTILEYAGLDIPTNMDGKSLVPIMEGKAKKVKDHQMVIQAWGDSPTQALTVLHKKYKYIYWFYGEGMEPKEELYNLESDMQEMHNLVTNDNYKQQLNEIRSVYDAYVDNWANECVKNERSRYIDYAKIYNRHIPWTEKRDLVKLQNLEKEEKEEAEKKAAKKAANAEKRKTKNKAKK